MRKLFYVFCYAFIACAIFTACSSDGVEDVIENITPLSKIKDVSLNYRFSSQTISLGRDVQNEGAVVSLKKGVSWINNITLSGNTVSFDVEENNNTSTGHRFDTLIISVKGQRIGTVCVTQARNPFSDTRLEWANTNALFRNQALCSENVSGLEMTKKIYNLEKTTNGKDSYKNYPAFAFCIEMNHDPENNMEWYLPSMGEIRSYEQALSYSGTPIAKHNYWWSSDENTFQGWRAFNVYSGSVASRGAVPKSEDWWVVAFRNGKIEE